MRSSRCKYTAPYSGRLTSEACLALYLSQLNSGKSLQGAACCVSLRNVEYLPVLRKCWQLIRLANDINLGEIGNTLFGKFSKFGKSQQPAARAAEPGVLLSVGAPRPSLRRKKFQEEEKRGVRMAKKEERPQVLMRLGGLASPHVIPPTVKHSNFHGPGVPGPK